METAKLARINRMKELGRIVLDAVGGPECVAGYGTDDPYWVGRYALAYGDINPDGTLN